MTTYCSTPAGAGWRGKRRDGFSLIEVLVSMTILAIVMSSLGALSFAVARRGKTNDLVTKRNFVLQQQVNKFGAMSYTNIGSYTQGSTSLTEYGFTFTRTVTITSPTPNSYTIKVVITPAVDPSKPDSVTFQRTRPATNTPLCTSC